MFFHKQNDVKILRKNANKIIYQETVYIVAKNSLSYYKLAGFCYYTKLNIKNKVENDNQLQSTNFYKKCDYKH